MHTALFASAVILSLGAGIGIGHWWGTRYTDGDAWVLTEGRPDGTVYLEIRDQSGPLAHITMEPQSARNVASRIIAASGVN